MVKGVGINIDTRRLSGSHEILRTELEKFQRFGFDYAEIPPAGLDVILDGKIVSKRLDPILQILKSCSLKFTVHGPDPVNLSSNREEDFSIVLATIDFASFVGAESVVYHCGWLGEDREKKDREIENLKKLCDKLEKMRVILVVENTRQTIEQTLEIVQAVNHPNVRLLIDVGHLFLRLRGNEKEFLRQISLGLPHAFELHVHDNFGKPEEDYEPMMASSLFAYLYGVGDLHLPIGYGRIPFEELFKLVREEFDGIVVLEINDMNRFEKDIPESLEKLRTLSTAGGVGHA
ncbi:hypothetical protein AS159_04930 [Thermotoga sp. Ku-13t]|uniref:sugar phosphate isomerase/epimerase family protein n=1 Tax=Thermotoga sp. Ku-13t TaxID=1755813 RepID=UPI0013EBC8C6|nr:sugar phosphate isomerase/epimerase family protein [Thermotoga sp. Ku-13t]KAF2957760.1 hypothetical protein AS159_04930 [Thermotoga sp. Ku-13t]